MVLRSLRAAARRWPLRRHFGSWRGDDRQLPGYTILLPTPMDMPFLLQAALESLAAVDTSNCGQLLVIPDGFSSAGGEQLLEVVAAQRDPRMQYVELQEFEKQAIHACSPPSGSFTHWVTLVAGINRANHEYIFLHDADAFLVGRDGIEQQYRTVSQSALDVLGVTARWDPFFRDQNACIAGTWEMIFAKRWARKRSPLHLMPSTWWTRHGEYMFDTTLYSQYLDRKTKRISISEAAPSFVHFNGTIVTYRQMRQSGSEGVNDDLFRVLLLSLLSDAITPGVARPPLPGLDELESGLTDPRARVRYQREINQKGYGEFRNMIEELCNCVAFRGQRASRIREACEPFDRHFRYVQGADYAPAVESGEVKAHGLS